jgi:Tfp pilus assembly protein PilV
MLEVIIAILTITAFLTGTLQLMAVNALYKVRAERQARANFWIQEDFESVKALASSLDVNSSPANPNVSKDVCTGTEGYATALRRQLTNTPIPTTLPTSTDQEVETRPIVGKKNYSLYRTFDITNQSANPHRLSINYRVEATDKNYKDYPNQENVIAESSVEVIPNASFKCPS